MKKLLLLSAVALAFAITACKTTERESDMATSQKDSLRMADSVNAAAMNVEQEDYDTRYTRSLDSFHTYLYSDSAAHMHNGKLDREWVEARDKFNVRMEMLKTRAKEGKAKSKEEWQKFRTEMDTAGSNLRSDWNRMMDKMKIKK
jgi:hypothetical protein